MIAAPGMDAGEAGFIVEAWVGNRMLTGFAANRNVRDFFLCHMISRPWYFHHGGNSNFRRPLARMKAFALLRFDHMDRRFEPVAMIGDRFRLGDVLLAETGFKSLTRGLINLCTDFGIVAIGIAERRFDSRF
jgi:hypothetical protein